MENSPEQIEMIQEPHNYGPSSFTRNEAPGAIPNGTTVRKTFEEEPGTETAPGTLGTVIGSIGGVKEEIANLPATKRAHMDPRLLSSEFFYFIEWRTSPNAVIGCLSEKVEEV